MDLKNIQMKEIWKALKFNGHGHERRKERKERKEKRKFTNMQRKSKKEEHNTINLRQTKPNEKQFICYKTTLRHIYSQNYLGGRPFENHCPSLVKYSQKPSDQTRIPFASICRFILISPPRRICEDKSKRRRLDLGRSAGYSSLVVLNWDRYINLGEF